MKQAPPLVELLHATEQKQILGLFIEQGDVRGRRQRSSVCVTQTEAPSETLSITGINLGLCAFTLGGLVCVSHHKMYPSSSPTRENYKNMSDKKQHCCKCQKVTNDENSSCSCFTSKFILRSAILSKKMTTLNMTQQMST